MVLQNQTRNQHFVSQTEQRLNAANPSAKSKNQKIYSFSLKDRESYSVTIDSTDARKIEGALCLEDLFSFDVLDDGNRYNFEKLFQQYEHNIAKSTQNILASLPVVGEDTKSEIRRLFDYKHLNFVRNPYSVEKILNTFSPLRKLRPTNPLHLADFNRVLQGRKPHQRRLCQQLNISEVDYPDWLSVLFLLLTQFTENSGNILEEVTEKMFQDPNNIVFVYIYTFDDKTCLISDRGYSIPTTPKSDHLAMDFNLFSRGFIRFFIGDVDALTPAHISKDVVAQFKATSKTFSVMNIQNDLNALEQYNKHVVYQCHQTVFNASRECYGIPCGQMINT